jgi:D-3-phosphoglycerate dehydrogenase
VPASERIKVLVPDDYGDRVRDLACVARYPQLELRIVPGPIANDDELARLLSDVDALVLIRERTRIGPELLDAARRLRMIAQLGLVRRNLSIADCTRRGIAVAEGPTLSRGTAELTWALIMAARRCVCEESSALKAGRWQSTFGDMLHGQTLGVWGYGRVGRIVAGYGHAFGMRVLVWGWERSIAAARADGHDVARTREELFESSDIVSVHVRLTPETHGIVTESDLSRMTPDALFVYTARAELVAHAALARALAGGRPGRVALDVFENEPASPQAEPLLAMKNVLAMPHMGYVNRQEYEALFEDALQNIASFFAGTPRNITNREVLERARS